eukprot:TRINITY_DN18617_c0_g1_i3.p1 TRINITY_DN18617_c0_g1~~TRINITY_DN18617_c0_g1_i3.p1  ORF type:complete len:301 (-),score=104.28 TRINITY_DN18617_c0_g1_i3:27-929(-)
MCIRDRIKSIFVGNLSFKLDESALGAAFLQCGDVVDVTIARDGGRSKGHGWVEFSTEEAANKAMYLNGHEINGRACRIGWGRGGGGGGGNSGPPAACWFCLSNPQVEEHLIVSVGNLTYLALAKGGLVDDHLLIVPIEHVPCASPIPPEVDQEIEKYKQALDKYWQSLGREMVSYERHIVMRNAEHFHIQVVALPKGEACKVVSAFRNHRSMLQFDTCEEELRPQGQGFAVEAAGETIIHQKSHAQIPLQLGREVLADLLKAPHRANWKECAVPQEEEAKLADAFKAAFAKFDPFAEADE